MSERIEMLREMMAKEVADYNAALQAKDVDKMSAAESEAKNLAEEYRVQAQNELFESCAKSDKPVYDAIKMGFYQTLRTKFEREDGVVVGMSLTTGERQIDLLALFRALNLDRQWLGNINKLGFLLTQRVVNGVTDSTRGTENYKMSEKGKKCEMKGNPLSNNGLLKLLQTTVDAIYFEDDGNGENVLKVNNRDVKYLIHCFSGKGGKLALRVANDGTLTRLIAEIMYRVANNFAYSVKYKVVDSDTALEVQKAANAKAKAAKAETAKVDAPETDATAVEEPETMVVPREESEEVA